MKRYLLIICVLLFSLNIFAQSKKTTNEAARPKIGLALGGGGAKGAACIGALKYIEQAGIKIDYIAGTSAGAIIGGLYSVGYTADQIDSLYRSQDWLNLLADRDTITNKWPISIDRAEKSAYFFGLPVFSGDKKFHRGPGVLRGDSLVAKMTELLGVADSINFDDLPIPFRSVSVDLNEFKEHVFSSGNMAVAIRASMSVPIAFRSVRLDGMKLVDGGLLNNLPVDIVKEMGADYIIAVDLSDPKRATQTGVDELKAKGLPALVAWQVARPDLKKLHENSEMADILIHPDVRGYNGASFRPEDAKELISRGEVAGKAALPKLLELKALVEKKEKTDKKEKTVKFEKSGKGLTMHVKD